MKWLPIKPWHCSLYLRYYNLCHPFFSPIKFHIVMLQGLTRCLLFRSGTYAQTAYDIKHSLAWNGICNSPPGKKETCLLLTASYNWTATKCQCYFRGSLL